MPAKGAAVQINPADRPSVLMVAGAPPEGLPPGPVAFIPALQCVADVGVALLAVEIVHGAGGDPDARHAAVAVAALGARPCVLSPGDVLGFI